LVGLIWAVGEPTAKPQPVLPTKPLHNPFGRLPLRFEENRGQTDQRVKFLSRGNGYSLFLTSTDAVLKLRAPSASKHPLVSEHNRSRFSVVRIKLKDANPDPQIAGIDELTAKSNYFVGRDPKKWHTHIPTFARVRFGNIYPGVSGRTRSIGL
jgi:hypothetical protein